MSTITRLRPLTVRLEERQAAALERQARANHRTPGQELRHLVDRHLGIGRHAEDRP